MWWVSSLNFIISSNFLGSALCLDSSLCFKFATLDTNVSNLDPGDASWEALNEYIDEASPDP